MSLLLGHRYTHETISAFLKVLREGLGVEKAAVSPLPGRGRS